MANRLTTRSLTPHAAMPTLAKPRNEPITMSQIHGRDFTPPAVAGEPWRDIDSSAPRHIAASSGSTNAVLWGSAGRRTTMPA